jgi:DNA-binding MarR family transcriptional regulator
MEDRIVNYSQQPIGRFLAGIGRSMLTLLGEKLNGLDIGRNFYALILIEEGNGMLTQQELADLLETDKVSVVRIIDYLSEKGYVIRQRTLLDKRKHGLTLTQKAQNELPQIKEAISDVIQLAFKGVTIKKKNELYQTLHIIKNNLKPGKER